MSLDAQNFLALIQSMRGKDMAMLSSDQRESFSAEVREKFKVSTEFVLHFMADFPWLESLVAVNNNIMYCPWVANFDMLPAERMESAIGEKEKIQLAAALFPDVAFKIHLHAEYRSSGLNQGPFATVFLVLAECTHEVAQLAIDIMETNAPSIFQQFRSFRIVSHEGANILINKPLNIAKAFKEARIDVQTEGSKADSLGYENLYLEVDIFENESPENTTNLIEAALLLYVAIVKVLYRAS